MGFCVMPGWRLHGLLTSNYEKIVLTHVNRTGVHPLYRNSEEEKRMDQYS